MKKLFTKKKILILTSIIMVMVFSVGAYALFGKRLEEIDIPSDADLSVTTMAKPTSGTPADYDPKMNLYVAQGVILETSFNTKTEGSTDCGVVNQDIYSERIVTPSATYKKSISYSSLVQVGVEYYAKSNQYLVREASSVKSISNYQFLNEDKYLTKLSETAFLSLYGKPCRGLTTYIINDSTVIEAFYVGKDQDGLHQFKFKLDPLVSSANIKNEMKTMAGSKKYPVVSEIEFTIWLDDNWVVSKTQNKASYKVERGPIVASCTENTTEYFTFNDTVKIPDEEYFATKIQSTSVSEDVKHEASATDILLDAFGNYLDGSTPLSLQFSSTGAVNLSGLLDLYINAENLDKIKAVAKINDTLNLQYNNENKTIYLSVGKTVEQSNKINFALSLNENADLFNSLLSKLNIKPTGTTINTAELLSALNIKNEETKLTLTFNKELAGINIDANIILEKSTNDITANIKINNDLDLCIKSIKNSLPLLATTENENSFKNIKPILDTLLQNESINLQLVSSNINGKIKANIFDKTILGNVEIFGKNINFELSNKAIWLEIDGILTKCDSLDKLINSKLLSNITLKTFDKNANILDEFLENLMVEESEDSYVISTKIFNIPLQLNCKLQGNYLQLKSISSTLGGGAFTIAPLEEFNAARFSDSQKLNAIKLNNIIDLLDKTSFNIDASLLGHSLKLNIVAEQKTISGILDNQLKVKYENNILYGVYNDLKFKITTTELKQLIDKIVVDLNLQSASLLNFEDIRIEDIIKTLSLKRTDNNLIASINILNQPISISLNIVDNCLDITSLSIKIGETTILINKATTPPPSIIVSNDFINAYNVVTNYYDTILNIINNKEVNLFGQIDVTIPTNDLQSNTLLNVKINNLTLNFEDTKNIKLATDLTLTLSKLVNNETTTKTYNLKLNYYNNRLFFNFDGVKGQFGTDTLRGSKEDINRILGNVPQLRTLLEKLSTLANININYKEWDLYSLLKNISIDENLDMLVVVNLSTLLADSISLNDLVIKIEKTENGGLNLLCDLNNLVNNISVKINTNVAPTTETVFEVENENNYTSFDSISNLIEVLANTVTLRHFHVGADLKISVLGINISSHLDLKIDVFDDFTFSGVITINHSAETLCLTKLQPEIRPFKNYLCETTLYLSANSDYIYGTKKYKSYKRANETVEYFKFDKSAFADNVLNYISYILDLSDYISEKINSANSGSSNSNFSANDIFKSYSYSESDRNYAIKLDLSKINSSLGETNINIKHTAKSENNSVKLEQITIKLNLVSIVSATLTGTLIDQDNINYGTAETVEAFINTHGTKCNNK